MADTPDFVGSDEAVVWQPLNMAESLVGAATGAYERDRTGPGFPSYDELFASAKRSAVHLEMRDTYAAPGDDPVFDNWHAGGPETEETRRIWDGWEETVRSMVSRGVNMRRLRLVSEPLSDYVRYEYDVSHRNISFGEDIRWLPRTEAVDLQFPGADYWMFDQRLVLFNFNSGNGTELPDETGIFMTDPRKVREVVASFEMAWGRATPHAEYKPS